MENIELKNRSALIIDDEAFMRELLCQAVQNSGINTVLSASGGAEALEILENATRPVDFIMCDLQMPDMDGIEVIRCLAASGYGGGVFLVSGEDQRILETAESIAKVRGLNVVGSLTKPVSADTINNLLNIYQESHQNLQHDLPDVDADELLSAISNGDIVPYYQPQIEVDSKHILGVEVLARWIHPEKGLIFPDIFIALAERTNHIDALTESIVQQSINQAAKWKKLGRAKRLSINISIDNLHVLDFPDRLAELVKKAGLESNEIILEITESSLVKDPGTCLDVLTRLRLKGFALSIDDFGTGYASMEHLKKMPFMELKVDRAFVHGAAFDKTSRAILESSISLARQLNMSVVAEGVEDQHDWDLVESLGCDLVQGYFITPPMAADALDIWFSEFK